MAVYALILAAGFSTRMEPHFKPLLPLPLPDGERSALAAVCSLYQSEGVRPVIVGGSRADSTRREAEKLGAAFTINRHPERGMFSSIRTGMAALAQDCTHVFVHPVDIPLVRRMTIRTLLEAAESAEISDDSPLIPCYRGTAGHPPLFPAAVRNAVLNAGDDGCLRTVLDGLCPVTVPVADSFILRDMDSPDDYRALCALAPRQNLLSSEEAEELLHVRRVQERGVEHCLAVGRVAAAFAAALNRARSAEGGPLIDEDLARTGGIVHDVCKGEPHHEAAAGRLFRSRGMEPMARLVEEHRDMTIPDTAPLTERELVFLADKFVRGHAPVPLKERFACKMERYAENPEAVAAIAGRMERAAAMAERLEKECGHSLEDLAREALPPSRTEAAE